MYSISACGGDKPLGTRKRQRQCEYLSVETHIDLLQRQKHAEQCSLKCPPERLVEKSHFLSGLFQHSLILDPVLHRRNRNYTPTAFNPKCVGDTQHVSSRILKKNKNQKEGLTIGKRTNFCRKSWESYRLKSPKSAANKRERLNEFLVLIMVTLPEWTSRHVSFWSRCIIGVEINCLMGFNPNFSSGGSLLRERIASSSDSAQLQNGSRFQAATTMQSIPGISTA